MGLVKKSELQREIEKLQARVAELEDEVKSLRLQVAIKPYVIPQPEPIKPTNPWVAPPDGWPPIVTYEYQVMDAAAPLPTTHTYMATGREQVSLTA